MICPQQQDLAIVFPDSQPFKPTTRQSNATVTYIEQDNSVVSPIVVDADDYSMAQFLQPELPFGCSSQSLIHNNAEPLVWINKAL